MTEWKKKRQTMRHYDHSASVYDAQYYEEQEAKIKAVLKKLTLEEKSLILDAGCGTGLLFPHVTEKAKLVLGIDISGIILKEAKKQVQRQANTAIIRADTDYAPFQNDIFDIAFAITLLQNTPKPHQTLNQMKRVTKRDAKIVATGLKKTFSRKKFTQLLRGAGLKIKVMTANENFNEYIATCTKSSKENLKRTQTAL